jgi:hypothetical protein
VTEHGSVWDDAHAALYFTDIDFREEFGRPRTEEEQAAHELFLDAAALEEADSITVGREGDDAG